MFDKLIIFKKNLFIDLAHFVLLLKKLKLYNILKYNKIFHNRFIYYC